MSEEVKLFGSWASPFSLRVQLALQIKGISYEYIEENLSNKSPELLKFNPVHKKVPVLLHNGKPVAESLIIIEYIDQTWKNNPLMPLDPFERSRARFWAVFLDEKILLSAWKCFMSIEEERKNAIEELWKQIEFLEKELTGKEFFGGEKIGFADIAGFAGGYWMLLIEEIMEIELIREEKFPAIAKWRKKLVDSDEVKECIPPKERHVSHLKAHRENLMKSAGSA